MEGVKVNGETAPANQNGPADTDSSGQTGAKSVISINNDKVTIVSTGKDGKSRGSKVTTTPLRTSPTPALAGTAHVSTKVRDTQFVAALTQQFQASNGMLMAPPVGGSRSVPSSTSSSRASHSRSSSSSSSTTEDLTAKLSSMLLLQQQQQQQQQQRQQQQQQQQQQQEAQQNASTAEEGRQPEVPESSSSPVSSCLSSSTTSSSTSSSTAPVLPNGTPNGRESGASSPEMPPPPPPSALLRSVSEQPALRKVDASYTPRPKSYSTQNSVTPGNGNPPVHNKNDLMAALSVAVNSGSAVAGLRKTRGPGRSGGVTEVVIPKKKAGASSMNEPASRRGEN